MSVDFLFSVFGLWVGMSPSPLVCAVLWSLWSDERKNKKMLAFVRACLQDKKA